MDDSLWPGAASEIIEIDARLLTVKVLFQCRVWSDPFAILYDRCQS